ncbi:MAG TPA: hypothetical protein VHD60_02145 [Candidatus Saccharimonadales bacterium]|nr:hypothetical protein [Candidatus Saccharimonadales bacterium]
MRVHAATSTLTYLDQSGSQTITGYPSDYSDITVQGGGLAVVSGGKVYTANGVVNGLDNVVKAYVNEPVGNTNIAVGFAIKSDGTLWSWGNGEQLGRVYDPLNTGQNQNDPTPAQVVGLPAVTDIAIGMDHVLALDVNGHVWSWGSNGWEQLGTDTGCTYTGQSYPAGNAACDVSTRVLPAQVPGLSDITSISAGRTSSVAVTADGTLMFWGQVCNIESPYPYYPAPTAYPGVGTVKQALTDDCSVTYLTNGGLVYSWGYQGANPTSPLQVTALQNIQSIKTDGYDTRIALDANGGAYMYAPATIASFFPVAVYPLGNIGVNSDYLAWNITHQAYPDGGVIVPNYGAPYTNQNIYFTVSTYSDSPANDLYSIKPNGVGPLHYASVNEANVSPDGTKVAYVSNCDIFVADLDGSNSVNITNNTPGTCDEFPTWSPDGTKVAFNETLPDDNTYLAVVNADGSNLHSLAVSVGGIPASWSPDGTKLAFTAWSADGSTVQIAIIDSTGSNENILAGDGNDWWSPSWSPDGTKLAITTDNYNDGNATTQFSTISTVNADGTGKVDLYTSNSDSGESEWNPVWSPDGSTIAFSYTNADGVAQILTVPAGGGDTTTLYDLGSASASIEALQWLQTTPTPAIQAPANLQAVSPTKTPALSWDAVANATSYNVYRDGTLVGTTTSTTYTDSTAVEGQYEYYVTAVGGSGESAASNTVTIVVDQTRPTMSFTSPSSFADPFTTGPVVTVTASDASGLKIMAIHVYTSANQLLTTCGSATQAQLAAGTMSCNLASLPSGTYYIKAGTFDNAGNNKTILSGNFTIL